MNNQSIMYNTHYPDSYNYLLQITTYRNLTFLESPQISLTHLYVALTIQRRVHWQLWPSRSYIAASPAQILPCHFIKLVWAASSFYPFSLYVSIALLRLPRTCILQAQCRPVDIPSPINLLTTYMDVASICSYELTGVDVRLTRRVALPTRSRIEEAFADPSAIRTVLFFFGSFLLVKF